MKKNDLLIFNTLGRKKEKFIPADPKRVKMYVCGPTVYDYLHIGNFRGPIFFNLVRNFLEYLGYPVEYVYNYTDIDDKIIARARAEKRSEIDIADQYIKAFCEDFAALKLRAHDCNPRVTETMDEIIDFISRLIAKGKAYECEGEVFYSIESWPEYGKLSKKKLDDLNAGERVEINDRKKNPFDFVLWKPSNSKSKIELEKNEEELAWNSPWGPGRPGWHIECSAMIEKFLGGSIDIHGGGVDLIFPHHENEIAQSEGVGHSPYVRYWMHNNFINLKNEKMSKSLGNVFKAKDFVARYHPEILKFVILNGHYRSIINIDQERIENAIAGLSRVYQALQLADNYLEKFPDPSTASSKPVSSPSSSFLDELNKHDTKIEEVLCDDFNTPEFLGIIFSATRAFNHLEINKRIKKKDFDREIFFTCQTYAQFIRKWGGIASLFNELPGQFLSALDHILMKERGLDWDLIESKVRARDRARAEKDFTAADILRDALTAMGVILHDDALGETRWEMKK